MSAIGGKADLGQCKSLQDKARQPLIRSRFAPNGGYSTTSVGTRSTGRDTLWKFGEVAITALWISTNCSREPLP